MSRVTARFPKRCSSPIRISTTSAVREAVRLRVLRPGAARPRARLRAGDRGAAAAQARGRLPERARRGRRELLGRVPGSSRSASVSGTTACTSRPSRCATTGRKPRTLRLPGSMVWTGDTRPIPELLAYYAGAGELVAHDCALRGNPSHSGLDDLEREYPAELLSRCVLTTTAARRRRGDARPQPSRRRPGEALELAPPRDPPAA